MSYWKQSKNNIYVAAHRGWCSQYPENTMTAFRKAMELGVDQIETDIRMSRDGELVLIHDSTVDRTTNGSGAVCDMTLQELRALDAGNGEKVPTLRELMEEVKDHPTITLDLELKVKPQDGREQEAYRVCDAILAMVDAYGFTDRVVINTFSGKLHEYIENTYGAKYRRHVFYPISNLGKITRDPYQTAYCCCMFATVYSHFNLAERSECDRMTERGIEPWAGAGVKDAAGVDAAIAAGVTLITCNNPDEILALLRQRGYHQ